MIQQQMGGEDMSVENFLDLAPESYREFYRKMFYGPGEGAKGVALRSRYDMLLSKTGRPK